MTATPLEASIVRVIEMCRGRVPDEQLDDMGQLALAGEPGIALENLATQLYEYEVAVEPGIVEQIEQLGTRMGLDPKYWTLLRETGR